MAELFLKAYGFPNLERWFNEGRKWAEVVWAGECCVLHETICVCFSDTSLGSLYTVVLYVGVDLDRAISRATISDVLACAAEIRKGCTQLLPVLGYLMRRHPSIPVQTLFPQTIVEELWPSLQYKGHNSFLEPRACANVFMLDCLFEATCTRTYVPTLTHRGRKFTYNILLQGSLPS